MILEAMPEKFYGGELSVGDNVIVLPSQTKSKIKEIYFYDKNMIPLLDALL